METSFSNQNVFDKVENWMANDTDEVTTPLSSYSDVGLAAGYEVHFSPDNERLFSDGLNEEKCMDCTRCRSLLECCMCCMCVRNRIAAIFTKIFPYGYKREFKGLFHIAWPITTLMMLEITIKIVSLMFCGYLGNVELDAVALATTTLTAILQKMLLFLSMTFCGHLSKESLDGVALATTIINVTGTSVLYGLSTAFDTLLSQTFGSSNKQKIGLIMQRGVVIMGLICLPIFAIFINTEHILLLIGQHHEVARLGGQYATILTVGFVGNVGNIVLQKYLQTQSIVIPGVLILIVVNILNAGIHYLFLFVFDFGVAGAAIAVCITYWTEIVLHFLYIIVSGIYKDTWTGFSKECLTDWKTFLHLAIPGMFMLCLEWWCFEILVFLCGLVGEVPLAAHVIVYYIASIVFMVPLGISISVGIKVGNQLGAGNPEEAMTTSRVAISMVLFCGIINSILMISLKDYIPRAFTDNLEVAHLASKLLPQLTIFCFFDFTQETLSGVLRGIGHQKFGSIVNVIAYYLLALPMSIPLILYTNLQVAGAWWSMCVSVGFQSVAFFIRIVMCNWEVESEKAQIRAGVKKKDENSKQSATRGHSIPSIIFEPDTVSTDTQLEQIEADHLTLSDISSYKSDIDENTTRHHSHLNSSIVLYRVVFLVFFLIIFVGGIVLKFYLDDRIINNSVKCLLINGTNINMTYISTELNQKKFNLSTTDWHILNFTYFYELNHGYNSTFVYCRDHVEPYSPSSHWTVLNNSLLYPHHFY